jgi:hypothetical protein
MPADEQILREGTISLQRVDSLSSSILGLCGMADTEIRISPVAHENSRQQVYTLAHEGRHREIFLTTTFGYTQFLLARLDVMAREGKQLPPGVRDVHLALCDLLDASFDAHEGYATLGEVLARDSLAALGDDVPDVAEPTPRYRRAMAPYRDVWQALPRWLQPFSHFILRAFAEAVFDAPLLHAWRQTRLDTAQLRSLVADKRCQPNARVHRLAASMVEALGEDDGRTRWPRFWLIANELGADAAREIANIRFTGLQREGVRVRRKLVTYARKNVRAILSERAHEVDIDDGPDEVMRFHNWCYAEYRDYRLLSGPMLDADDDFDRYVDVVTRNLHVSGHPAETLPIVSAEGVPPGYLDELARPPARRLAVGLRVEGTVPHNSACVLRCATFAPKTEAWNGPGTTPYQRIFVEGPCVDIRISADKAGELLASLRDRVDILYFDTRESTPEQARLADEIVGETKATMIYLVEEMLGLHTDRHKLAAIRMWRSSGVRCVVPFSDGNWVAVFYEMAPRTFLGAIVLWMSLDLGGDDSLSEWIRERVTEQMGPVIDARSQIAHGDLSTFSKLFVHGTFRALTL